MRYLGIDYGRKRIGVALGEDGMVKPLLVFLNDDKVIEKIRNLCEQEEVDGVVIGVVDNFRGEISKFTQKLKEIINLPVIFQDETLTTKEGVDKMIKNGTNRKARRERIDAIAAAEILESYFKKVNVKCKKTLLNCYIVTLL